MVLGSIVIEAGIDALDVSDEDVRLDGVEAPAGRARLLQRRDVFPDLDQAAAAEDLVADDAQLLDRERSNGVEGARRLPASEGGEDTVLTARERELECSVATVDLVKVRRRLPEPLHERRGCRVGLQRKLLGVGEAPPEIDVAPRRQRVKEGRVDVPRAGRELLVFSAELGQERVVLGAENETLLREPRDFLPLSRGKLLDTCPAV